MTRRQWLLLLLLSMLWGGSFFFVAIAVRDVPPFTIVIVRIGLAALILLAIARLQVLPLPTTAAAWWPYAVMGLVSNALPFSLIVTGQTQISSGLASVLNATTPLWSLIVARALARDEPLGANRLAGVVTGIAGVAILVGPEALASRQSTVLGMTCGLAAAISYGFAALWGRRFKTVPPTLSSACQLICGTVMMAPLWLAVDRPWTMAWPRTETVAALLALACFSTALAYQIFYRIMAEAGPQNATLVTLLVPVSAITLGVVFLGETLEVRHLVGALVIAAALALIDGRLTTSARRGG